MNIAKGAFTPITFGSAEVAQIASNIEAVSDVVDASAMLSALVRVCIGKNHTNAFTAGFAVKLQGTSDEDGNPRWNTLAVLGQTSITASLSQALGGGAEAPGSKVLEMGATANMLANQDILVLNGTLANSEFARTVAVVLNTSITIRDGIRLTQTGSVIYNRAEVFQGVIPLEQVNQMRVVCESTGTGQTYVIEATYQALTFS